MDQTDQKKKTGTQTWIDFLASLKVTFVTLLSLGLATLAGTIIPQMGISLSGEVLESKLHEPLWRIALVTGFLDVFHSAWFLFLVLLLVVNLVTCTLRFISRTRRQLSVTGPVLDQKAEARVSIVERRPSKTDPIEMASRLETKLVAIGRVNRQAQAGTVYLFAQNSPLSRYGNVIIHCSILLIVMGAIVRMFWGIEGQMLIPDGGLQRIFTKTDGSLLYLPFEMHCDKFDIQYYPDGQRVKSYRSSLTATQNGREVAKRTITVGSPMAVSGFHFFQATWGEQPFPVLQIKGERLDKTLPVIFHQIQIIPGAKDALVVEDSRERAGQKEIFVKLHSGGQELEGWLTEGGALQPLGHYQVAFAAVKRGRYTGLQVSVDPSVPLFMIGSLIFFIGLMWGLLADHRRVWARIEPEQVVLAASSSKNHERMAAWVGEILKTMGKN